MQKIQREPVMIGGLLVAVLQMFFVMAIQLGWLDWNSDQIASVNNFIVALVQLLVLGIPIIVAYFIRNRVTPVADPRTPDGEEAVIISKP